MTDVAEVAALLWPEVGPGESLWAVLDAARKPEIAWRLRRAEVPHDCLYQGPAREELWYAAPYLVQCRPDDPFFQWLLTGWGDSWGIFCTSRAALAELRGHLRKFLLVTVEGSPDRHYFRFYDPRVLRAWLPTCERPAALEFFGPVTRYLAEGAGGGALLRFTGEGAGRTDVIPR